MAETSDSLLTDLAPLGRFLDYNVEQMLGEQGEATDTRLQAVSGGSVLIGYRSFTNVNRPTVVVAAPARTDDATLGMRRRDLGVLVLFATALGALAALWLSGIAARQLARPIGTLRAAALAIAGGDRMPPLGDEPTVEFSPVFTAFQRMAEDLHASRIALEEAQRRTAAVLRDVASGVTAIDPDGFVSLANPSMETLLGGTLLPGTRFADRAPGALNELVDRFLAGSEGDELFELEIEQRQLRGALTRLAPGGAVVTLDDVTDVARAHRVLAWGEMARQIAHEIKNPLTPIRLGVQHLRRARADKRIDFDRVLESNVNQILIEIDRLDEIARAFSRYGAVPEERRRPETIDVAAIVREVISLERMGADGGTGVIWEEEGADAPVRAYALGDELKDVLLNLLENARLADARTVRVSLAVGDDASGERTVLMTVRDDGHGIPPDVLPRLFEPHFSTRTSGSGLGLAISRRLVEGWGGGIKIESEAGKGTTVQLTLRAE
jgi:nitrogen fixation/metabolism regulation signal transduction histidine kinase